MRKLNFGVCCFVNVEFLFHIICRKAYPSLIVSCMALAECINQIIHFCKEVRKLYSTEYIINIFHKIWIPITRKLVYEKVNGKKGQRLKWVMSVVFAAVVVIVLTFETVQKVSFYYLLYHNILRQNIYFTQLVLYSSIYNQGCSLRFDCT